MIRLITTFLILIQAALIAAQADSISVSLSSGWNGSRMVDEYLSPLQYSGGGYLIQAGLEEYNDRYYDRFGISYQQNAIDPGLHPNSSADLYRGSIDWIRAWNIKSSPEAVRFFLGGHFLANYAGIAHSVWPNNSYSHSLAFNLGPSLVASYTPLPSPQDLLIAWELSLPLINYIIRPSAGSLIPDGAVQRGRNTTWSVITGGRLTSLHEYQRVCSNIYLSTRFTPSMNVRLGYQWDFQNYSVNNHFRSANHLLYIGLSYRFYKR